ncbi:host attachment protein [Candidatus Uhrbacteria bacterium]|nr:host attachment protein [Candidatus Uhrbacteria bacterium]
MQLPQELQKFPVATLIVTADSMQAKIYLIGGDALDEVASLAVPREKSQDNEGSFASADGSRVAGPVDEDDTPRFDSFVRQLARQTIDLTRRHKVEQLDCVMPAEVEHALADQLPSDVGTLIKRRLHKDLMKQAPVEMIRHLLEA